MEKQQEVIEKENRQKAMDQNNIIVDFTEVKRSPVHLWRQSNKSKNLNVLGEGGGGSSIAARQRPYPQVSKV